MLPPLVMYTYMVYNLLCMNIKSKKTLETLESISGKKLTFGNLLWAIRKGDDKTQVEFAELLNISKQYLCDLEHNRRFVSPKTAAEYANKLGYSRKQFIRLCFQDMLNRDGIPFQVDIQAA